MAPSAATMATTKAPSIFASPMSATGWNRSWGTNNDRAASDGNRSGLGRARFTGTADHGRDPPGGRHRDRRAGFGSGADRRESRRRVGRSPMAQESGPSVVSPELDGGHRRR